ncbi:MAG: hypothetical protein IJN19_05085 [Opitutales bacterium]|nr:hypothetical protein [Opitutales bacterium]
MNIIRDICVYYLLVWPLTPPLRGGVLWQGLFIVCFFTFLMLGGGGSALKRLKFTLFGCVTFVLILLLTYFRYGFLSGYTLVTSIGCYCVYNIILGYYQDVGWGRFVSVFLCLSLSLIVWNVTTCYALTINPWIARSLAADATGGLLVVDSGLAMICGGFQYVYTSALLAPLFLLCVFQKGVGMSEKCALGVCGLSSICVVALSGYSIANVALVLGIFLCVFHRFFSIFNFFVIVVSSILVIRAFWKNLYAILVSLAGDRLEYLNKIEAVFYPESSGRGEFDSRLFLWKESIDSFFRNPIVGDGVAGGHSGILDLFGMYGGFIGGMMLFFMFYPLFRIKSSLDRSVLNGIIPVMLLPFLMIVILNPFQNAYGVVLFVLFPYICSRYFSRDRDLLGSPRRLVAL